MTDSRHEERPRALPDGPILVVHPGAELYGSDRVLLDSVIGFVATGRRVVVTLPGDGPLVDALRAAGAEVDTATSFVLRKRLMKPSGWGELLRTGWGGARTLRRLIRSVRPSVVYVSTITLPLATLLPRMRRIPVVLHVHEGESGGSPALKRAIYGSALAAGRIIANSTFSRDAMVTTYPRLSGRAVVLSNPVQAPPRSSPPRRRLDHDVRLAYLGRLSPRKGPDLIIEALRLLDAQGIRARLDIVGSTFEGYEGYEQELRSTIAELGFGDRVTLHGFQPTVWAFLDHADALIVPSRIDEGYGNTAVEGILARRPVVVSDTSGLREATVGISTAILVTPDSAGAIADGVTDVVRRWGEIRDGVDGAYDIARERHSPAAYQRRVAQLLEGREP